MSSKWDTQRRVSGSHKNIQAAVIYFSSIDMDLARASFKWSFHIVRHAASFILFSLCSVHFLIYYFCILCGTCVKHLFTHLILQSFHY